MNINPGERETSGETALVVNFYAGPGAGKTTAAMELTVELKKRGYDAEYVPEYAKELVRRGRLEELNDQRKVTGEQIARIRCLLDACEVIVTDSPLLLGEIYAMGRPGYDDFGAELYREFCAMKNLDVFINRNGKYDPRGRLQSESEAKIKDREIFCMLARYELPAMFHNVGDRFEHIIRQIDRATGKQLQVGK